MAIVQPTQNFDVPNFEHILEETGWGLYYEFLHAFAIITNFTSAIVTLSVIFGILGAICDIISIYDVIYVHIFFYFGRGFGGGLLSILSDTTGKKCMITQSFVVIFISSLLGAFSHNAYFLCVAAFFLGCGLQTNVVCTRIYFAEIVPKSRRGFYLISLDLGWFLGYTIVSIFHYFLEDSTIVNDYQRPTMKLTSWRVAFAISGGLNLILACASALLEIGPRYVLFKKRNDLCVIILKQFYAINKSKYSEYFELSISDVNNLIHDYGIIVIREPVNICEQTLITISTMTQMVKLLIDKRFIMRFLSVLLIKLTIFYGIIGTHNFLSKTIQVDAETNFIGLDLLNINLPKYNDCQQSIDNLYKEYFELLPNILMGQLLCLLLIDRCNRKLLTGISLGICAGASFTIGFCDQYPLKTLMCCLLMVSISFVESIINVLITEIFPTVIRGTAAGCVDICCFIFACCAYMLLSTNYLIIFTIFGVIFAAAISLTYCVPNFRRQPMFE